MDTRMYVITHKAYKKPDDSMYISLGVGKKLNTALEYPGDDTGDNISEKNKSYCELTGIYWIWKNVSCDIVGICHYRRYFVHDNAFLTRNYIEETLKNYDVIVSRSANTECETLDAQYRENHHGKDLDLCREIISNRCPDYLPAFDLCMQCNLFTLGNMMITTKENFDKYCSWLFPILAELEAATDISGYDNYQTRIFGFLAERLLRIWLLNSSLKVCEEEVRMTDQEAVENDARAGELKCHYVECQVRDLVTLYKAGRAFDMEEITPLSIDLHKKIPVWTCWLDGEQNAPEIVRVCLASIRKNMPSEITELHVITFENISNYITLPSWIIEKFNQGKISMGHLSDILRMGLLYRYGGMWIDADCFIAAPIPESFFSGFHTLRTTQDLQNADITKGRWSCALISGERGNVLFRFVLNGLYLYWYKTDTPIDPHLGDDLIAISFDNIPGVRGMIEACPLTNTNAFALADNLNKKYNDAKYRKLTEDTFVFKLSHRLSPEIKTIVGDATYYAHMCGR